MNNDNSVNSDVNKLVSKNFKDLIMTDTKQDELREQTRRSIARLVASSRGEEDWNDNDYMIAGNIIVVFSKLMKTNTNTEVTAVLDRLENTGRSEDDFRAAIEAEKRRYE